MVSHVGNESGLFTPAQVVSDASFEQFLNDFMPQSDLDATRDAIRSQYNCSINPYNGDYRACVRDLIRDSSFTCNVRQLFDAYKNLANVYMMQYDLPGPYSKVLAPHGSDIAPTFINEDTDILLWLNSILHNITEATELRLILKPMHGRYQSYLASYAVSGDPNTGKKNSSDPQWTVASVDPTGALTNVFQAGYYKPLSGVFFTGDTTDEITTSSICDFWNEVAQNISAAFPSIRDGAEDLLFQKPEL